MNEKLKELKKKRAKLRKIEDTIRHYEKLYKADGTIYPHEQAQLNQLNQDLVTVKAEITKKIKELSNSEKIENDKNTWEEKLKDNASTKDDVVDHTLLKKKYLPIKKHQVKEGDTYSEISRKTGVSVEDLRAWNGYEDKKIPKGVELLLQNPMEIPLEQIETELQKKFEEWQEQNNNNNVYIASPTEKDNNTLDDGNWRPKIEESTYGLFPDNGYSVGSGVVSLKDIKQRQIYIYIDKTAKTAQEFLKKYEQQVKTDYIKAKQITLDASRARNESRAKFQKNPKLSYGAKEISKALDQDRSVATLVRKYGPGSEDNLSGEALRKHLIQKSGSTSTTLKNFNKISKVAGPAGLGVGIVSSAVTIIDNPSFESVLGEVSAWIGGAVGTSIGIGLAAAAIAALGGSGFVILGGALLAGIGIGMVTGYLAQKAGSWLGSLIDGILWIKIRLDHIFYI